MSELSQFANRGLDDDLDKSSAQRSTPNVTADVTQNVLQSAVSSRNDDSVKSKTVTFSTTVNNSSLEELLQERAVLEPMHKSIPRLWSILNSEIARLSAEAYANRRTRASSDSNGVHCDGKKPFSESLSSALSRANSMPSPLLTWQQYGAKCAKRRLKVAIPSDQYPDYNFVGRLLGPRGATLKSLSSEHKCKIMIRGKGSIRKDKEEEVRGKCGYEHVFNEPLHVIIEADDNLDDITAARALRRAKEAVELLLVPVPEERDGLKRQQLRALAIINGTYRNAQSRSIDALGSLLTSSSVLEASLGLTRGCNSATGSRQKSHSSAQGTPQMNGRSYTESPHVTNGCNVQSSSQSGVSPHAFSAICDFLSDESGYGGDNKLRRHKSQPAQVNSERNTMDSRFAMFGSKLVEQNMLRQRMSRLERLNLAESQRENNVNSNVEMTPFMTKVNHGGAEDFTSPVDNSPESSHSSEEGIPEIVKMNGNACFERLNNMEAGNGPNVPLGVGGLLEPNFYNGVFSNDFGLRSWNARVGRECVGSVESVDPWANNFSFNVTRSGNGPYDGNGSSSQMLTNSATITSRPH